MTMLLGELVTLKPLVHAPLGYQPSGRPRRTPTQAQRLAELPPITDDDPSNRAEYLFCPQIGTWVYAEDFPVVLLILNEVNNPRVPHDARHGAPGHKAHRSHGCRGPLCARTSRIASQGPSKSARYIRQEPLMVLLQDWYNKIWLERETARLKGELERETAA